MRRIVIKRNNADKAMLDAVSALKRGCIIAYATETFYALGVRFDARDSLQRLYELKKRPLEKAIPLIIGQRELLADIVQDGWLKNMSSRAWLLMDRFWPGPLTLLFPAGKGLSEYLTADTGAVAARIPGESFALQLARRSEFPITATSANLSGMQPADNAEDVIRYFNGSIDLVIDNGPAPGGLPSTIADVSGSEIKVIREGAITRGEIEKVVSSASQ